MNTNKNKGFTLIELLVVAVIMAMIFPTVVDQLNKATWTFLIEKTRAELSQTANLLIY